VEVVNERSKEGGEEAGIFPSELTGVFVRVEKFQPGYSFACRLGVKDLRRGVNLLETRDVGNVTKYKHKR
jgi:hypothetical protein